MDRGRLFASIEHIERQHARAIEKPAPSPRPRATLTAPPAAAQAVRSRPPRTPATTRAEQLFAPPKDRPGTVRLRAKALKVAMPLDPAQLAAIPLPPNTPAPPMVIEVGSRRCRVQVNAKNLRKVLTAIAEHGVEAVVVILQGVLGPDDAITEAGFTAQVRKARAEAPAA
jgi:hypothetical protein